MKLHEADQSCKEVFALLSEYLDQDLSTATCEALETHLQGCPPCIEFVETLRKSIDLCRQYAPAEVPQPLSDNARSQLRDAYRKMLSERENSLQ